MIFDSILSGKKNLFWIGFHILLGFLATYTSVALIIWFYIILFTSLNKSIFYLRNGSAFYYIALVTYLVSFELLGRMTKAYPFIPIELSKYFIVLFSILGIVISQKRNVFWFVLVIISGILFFVEKSGERNIFDIINNYMGFLAICLVLSFVLAQRFDNVLIHKFLTLILYSIISSLFSSFIKTPNFEDIQFTISANFETSGGAATNQVSTVFGLGFLLCFYFWYKKIRFSGYRNLDLLLGLSFLAQGLLTFSRGGIIVAILAVVFFIFLESRRINLKLLYFGIITSLFVIITFNYIDTLSGGKLSLRYQGETEGTYNYGAEKNLNKITSGRSMIFQEDLKLWFSNPILGVGVGSSRYLRGGTDEKITAHIELSRLLAEQGIFGLIYFLALTNLGIKLWRKSRFDRSKAIYFILFFVGYLTTFHAAMRTFVTPLLIGLSVLGIQNEKKKNAYTIHRSN
jgi:hypothetical protein